MKKIIYIVLGVGLVGATIVTLMNNKKQNEADTAMVAQENSSVAVRVATVATNPVEDNFIANGNYVLILNGNNNYIHGRTVGPFHPMSYIKHDTIINGYNNYIFCGQFGLIANGISNKINNY